MKAIKRYACLGGILAGGAVFVVAGVVCLASVNAMAICFLCLDEDAV